MKNDGNGWLARSLESYYWMFGQYDGASSTCVSSRRCVRSWRTCAGWACWWSMATLIWTLAASPAWVRVRTPSSASR